jgi:hypothetical protein
MGRVLVLAGRLVLRWLIAGARAVVVLVKVLASLKIGTKRPRGLLQVPWARIVESLSHLSARWWNYLQR